jgi:ribosome-binding protein aMBF1 (putative translation factor)
MENLRGNGGSSGKMAGKKGHVCSLCKNEITKPAKQFCIDGSEVEVCPLCCEKIGGVEYCPLNKFSFLR